MNWQFLKKSSRSWCLTVRFCVWNQNVSLLFWAHIKAVHLLSTSETSIIEEYERNLQFEQQYISSVVEGMDEMHVICPICHAWVKEMPVVTHRFMLVDEMQICSVVPQTRNVSSRKCVLHTNDDRCKVQLFNLNVLLVSRRNNLNINSYFISCICGLYINTKVCMLNITYY